MNKVTLWVCIGAGLVLIVLGALAGRAVWSAKPVTITTVDTLRYYEYQLDSIKASIASTSTAKRKGGAVIYWKHDTIRVAYEDTSTISALYSLIGQMQGQTTGEAISHTTTTIPAPAGYKYGFAFGYGTALNKHSTEFNLGPSIGGTKGVISLSAGYHPWELNDKWRGNLNYIRWFR